MKYKTILIICLSVFIGLNALTASTRTAQAQTLIRDAEIESYMAEWFEPIFKANNMAPEQVKIIIVQDTDINAFVAGGSNIFFFTGLLQKTDTPEELIGVMAHELGHISGGHLVRGRKAMEQASYESILGTIIGIGAAIATGDAGAAAAVSGGGSSVAQRRFLSTARSFESSADQAALRSLEAAQLNPAGFLTFMEKLSSEEFLPDSQQSEYVRSHPLTRTRIDSIQAGIERSKFQEKARSDKWAKQHARMKAKLMGFIQPQQVAWVYDDLDQSVPALYARSISYYRENNLSKAIGAVDALLTKESQNPYFYELKGQILFEFGRLNESIAPYKRALELKPEASLIRIALAHAQIETANGNEKQLNDAIVNLKRALRDEPRSTQIHHFLSTAYGRLGQEPQAKLHLAEEALLKRNIPFAKQQATYALNNLPANGADWLRAKDILLFIEQKK